MESFYTYRQRDGESVMDFSHRLAGIFGALQAREWATSAKRTPDLALRDLFARRLRDKVLVNTLQEKIQFPFPILPIHLLPLTIPAPPTVVFTEV